MMDEEAVGWLVTETWASAMQMAAKMAREQAATLPTEINGRAALIAYADTCDALLAHKTQQ